MYTIYIHKLSCINNHGMSNVLCNMYVKFNSDAFAFCTDILDAKP